MNRTFSTPQLLWTSLDKSPIIHCPRTLPVPPALLLKTQGEKSLDLKSHKVGTFSGFFFYEPIFFQSWPQFEGQAVFYENERPGQPSHRPSVHPAQSTSQQVPWHQHNQGGRWGEGTRKAKQGGRRPPRENYQVWSLVTTFFFQLTQNDLSSHTACFAVSFTNIFVPHQGHTLCHTKKSFSIWSPFCQLCI